MSSNVIRDRILKKGSDILNVYFTAGYPQLNDTTAIICHLAEAGVDLIELGMPYSDPLADGLTIQQSSEKALKNGMNLSLLFSQVEAARKSTDVPIIAMGYYNQLLQYGVEKFLSDASQAGINGMIIPDLPMPVYEKEYIPLFQKYNLSVSFLISPMTDDERIRQADRLSSAFIYVVSQSSITGKSDDISEKQKAYFSRIKNMNLSSPTLIGFGIHDQNTFRIASDFSHGAIVGSAFIRALNSELSLKERVHNFIKSIRS
jgi:tryptophan synthase alpha chain